MRKIKYAGNYGTENLVDCIFGGNPIDEGIDIDDIFEKAIDEIADNLPEGYAWLPDYGEMIALEGTERWKCNEAFNEAWGTGIDTIIEMVE